MFQELSALVKSSPIALLIAGEGDQLRVTVTQKNGKHGLPISLSIVSSPAELDAELAGAIVNAAGELREAKPIAEQVRSQVDTAKTGSSPKRTKAAKSKKPTPAAGKKVAPPKSAPKAKKTPAPKPEPKKAAPPASAKKKAAAPASRAQHTRDECLEDLGNLVQEHGAETVNREFFLKNARTARSFERHFGGWHKFTEAAGYSSTEKSAEAAHDDTLPLPLEMSTAPADEADTPLDMTPKGDIVTGTASAAEQSESATPPAAALPASAAEDAVLPATGGEADLPDTWPFPTTPKDVELGNDKNDTLHGRDVYDELGNYLSSITTRPAIGEHVHLTSQPTPLEVISIDGRRLITKPVPRPQPAATATTRDVVLADGKLIMVEGREVTVGEDLTYGAKGTFRVTEQSAERIVVAPVVPIAEAAAVDRTPPLSILDDPHAVRAVPKVRKVIDDDGALVGQHAGEVPCEGETLAVDGRNFTVMGFNEKAVFVEPATAEA